MVLFGAGSSATSGPPPPYKETNSTAPVLSVTTTEVVTTTSTTHFFSFPLWARKIKTSTTSPPQPEALVARPESNLYKDLPLPPSEANETLITDDSRPNGSRVSSSFTSPGQHEPNTLQMLAHASLGIGLPHGVGSAGSPNTAPPLRNAQSVQKLRTSSSATPVDDQDFNEKRARRLSLGTSIMSFSSEPKRKSNEQESPSLTRRSSFWSRKRSRPTTPNSNIPVPEPSLLPNVPPISPFFNQHPESATPSTEHSRGLSRSRSERTSLRQSSQIHEAPPPLPVAARRGQRSTTLQPDSLFTQNSEPFPSTLIAASPPKQNVAIPRPRSHTNPPLLHRLSATLFTTPPQTSVPVRNSISSIHSNNSPRPSTQKPPVQIPKPNVDQESPEIYLSRLLEAVSKAEVAGVLASSNDAFHVRALRVYIEQFNFVADPLDVALRKLLMDVGLPRETQQIDRVMEAFAIRYLQCNPNLFISEDHPYILAFSLIMLHTDAFNKSNKRKMSKAEYIKNTRLPGIAPEILDCFYDNIVFAPFIFVEDPLDVNGQRGLVFQSSSNRVPSSVWSPTSNPTSPSGSTLMGKGGKVDPYYLIAHNLLEPLRVDVNTIVPINEPYSYRGTVESWDELSLLHAFAKASVVQIGPMDLSRPFFGMNAMGTPSTLPETASSHGQVCTVKVTKAGILNRKDDILEGGKKASNRKWRPYSVILTGSQLLMFRDPTLVAEINAQPSSSPATLISPSIFFKPDELLSVKDSIAVFDTTYNKYDNTMRFVMPGGVQILLQAANESELNEWISRINYSSTFKSAGVRMRPLGMSGKDVQMTGVAAAASHLHDMQLPKLANARASWEEGDSSMSTTRTLPSLAHLRADSMSSVPVAPEIEGADQFKATFDQVKADLAAGHLDIFTIPSSPDDAASFEYSLPTTAQSSRSGLPSRSEIIRSKVNDLDSRLLASKTQLDSDLRFVRNIGTLTPFQRSTRDRLHITVHSMAKRIAQVRLDIAKLSCHRDVLSNDLVAEYNAYRRGTKLAMLAATETLNSRRDPKVPMMTLSFHSENRPSPRPVQSKQEARRPESSICESFHSALDFAPDWSMADDSELLSSFLNGSQVVESPTHSSSGSFHNISDRNTSMDDISHEHHERFYTAREEAPDQEEELAEDWHRTRCAQRVSLARLPSEMKLLTLIDRHNTTTEDT